MLEPAQVQMVLVHIYIFQKVSGMLFWVWKIHPEVCDSSQLINATLKNTFLHSIWKKISSTLGIGQVNFLVTLLSAW